MGHFDDDSDMPQACGPAQTGGHDEVGAAAFFAVRHLAREDRGEAFFAHAGAAQNAQALQKFGRGHYHHGIAQFVGADLVKKRDVENHNASAAHRIFAQKFCARRADQRMEDSFEPTERRWIAKDTRPQGGPIDGTVFHDTRERCLDRRHGRAARAQQRVDLDVGIMDRHAQPPECGGGRRLAHRDGAGKPQNHHARMTLKARLAPGTRSRQHVRKQGLIHHRLDAEPGGKPGPCLMQQHADTVDGRMTLGLGGF